MFYINRLNRTITEFNSIRPYQAFSNFINLGSWHIIVQAVIASSSTLFGRIYPPKKLSYISALSKISDSEFLQILLCALHRCTNLLSSYNGIFTVFLYFKICVTEWQYSHSIPHRFPLNINHGSSLQKPGIFHYMFSTDSFPSFIK